VVKYRNIARDINTSIKQYRCWISDGYPGIDGYGFYGSKSGVNDFIDYNYYSIPDGYTSNFLFPLAEEIARTKFTLPYPTDGASLLVLDGYIYLFGGKGSNKILRSLINDPNKWIDTQATIPEQLYDSSLILNKELGYIYLVGGNISYDCYHLPTKNVYRANITNPLVWETLVDRIPEAMSGMQIVYHGDNFYILGGKNSLGEYSTTVYLSNSLGDASQWNVFFPYAIDNGLSYCGCIINYKTDELYLFGGETNLGWSNKIYSRSANLSNDLSNFELVGTLPYKISRPNIFIIGNTVYMYTHVDDNIDELSFCKILKCSVDNLSDGWKECDTVIINGSFNSQLAIIDNRIYLFGGSGSTNIQTSNQKIQYIYNDINVVEYDFTLNDINQITDTKIVSNRLGYNYWITNYK